MIKTQVQEIFEEHYTKAAGKAPDETVIKHMQYVQDAMMHYAELQCQKIVKSYEAEIESTAGDKSAGFWGRAASRRLGEVKNLTVALEIVRESFLDDGSFSFSEPASPGSNHVIGTLNKHTNDDLRQQAKEIIKERKVNYEQFKY